MVVAGRSSQIEAEIDTDYCERRGIPIIRRASGGATIVTGPGCLMYAVLLDINRRPELQMVDAAHQFVMSRTAAALTELGFPVHIKGICDVALSDRKVSGNALRCKRSHLIYHGTILCDFSIELIESCLRMPPRQPEYRKRRTHRDFLVALNTSTSSVAEALTSQWGANQPLADWPQQKMKKLVAEKYSQDTWNRKR